MRLLSGVFWAISKTNRVSTKQKLKIDSADTDRVRVVAYRGSFYTNAGAPIDPKHRTHVAKVAMPWDQVTEEEQEIELYRECSDDRDRQ